MNVLINSGHKFFQRAHFRNLFSSLFVCRFLLNLFDIPLQFLLEIAHPLLTAKYVQKPTILVSLKHSIQRLLQ